MEGMLALDAYSGFVVHISMTWDSALLLVCSCHTHCAPARLLRCHPLPVRCRHLPCSPATCSSCRRWCCRRHAQVVSALLSHGADVNMRDHDGSTPLHYAADLGPDSTGEVEIVSALIGAGAAIDAKDGRGHTALLLAQKAGHTAVAEALVAAGAATE